MGSEILNVAVVGASKRGSNVVRNFAIANRCNMVCVESRFRYKEIEPGVLKCLDLDEEAPLPADTAIGKKSYDELKPKGD